MRPTITPVLILALVLALILDLIMATAAHAQPADPEEADIALALDTGWVTNRSPKRNVIAAHVLTASGAPWVRLRFDEATLGAAHAGGSPTVLRITSLLDGATQTLNALHLRQWRHSSAYFNGDRVLLELIADGGAAPSRVTLSTATIGVHTAPADLTICGDLDDRELSYDARLGRIGPTICTAWMIDDSAHCFLTAGHCIDAGTDIVEFNVPLSDANGNVQHPDPEDQYAIDTTSFQYVNGGFGNDWAHFGCFANTETNLLPYEAQGNWFTLAATPPDLAGQPIRVTGYGSTLPPVAWEWWKVQKTHVGAYYLRTPTYVRYTVDTTGGNSGSPVIDETTGLAIAIHTHGGCTVVSGANYGTSIDNAGLAGALANPLGACAETSCLTDVTGPGGGSDGNVDALDFLMLISQWASPCFGSCETDVTGAVPGVPDNSVDALDLLLMISQWGSPGNC